MVIGGVGAAVMLVLFLLQSKVGARIRASRTIAAILAIMLFFLGVAYTPWMASFTETVEHRNPAAVATGLAIWGWIIRVVVFASSLLLLVVINSVTPLVNYGEHRGGIRGPVPVAGVGRVARQGRRRGDAVQRTADVRGDAPHHRRDREGGYDADRQRGRSSLPSWQ